MSALSTALKTLKNIGRSVKWGAIHYYNVAFLAHYLSRHKKRIKAKVKRGEKLNVLFLLQYPEMWNSEKSVYSSMRSSNMYSPLIVTLPKQKGVNYSNNQFMEVNEASLFCKSENLEFFDTWDDNKWKDIDRLDSDFIFIQRPYDECMPRHLSLNELAKKAIVCYIPYGYNFNDIHFPIEYNINFFNNVCCYFADCRDSFEYVKNRYKLDGILGIRRSFNLGYPRFDLIRQLNEDTDKRNTVLWIPRWSIDEANDRSFFFDYLDVLIKYFETHSELSLIIRPHPLMFTNFIEKGVMTAEQVESFKNTINDHPNMCLDPNYDYLDTFEKSDLMISDFSSLMIEFFASLKPIIFCGDNVERYTDFGKRMMEGVYFARNGEELTSRIDELSNSNSIYYERNRELMKELAGTGESVGKAIVEALTDTYIE